VRTPEFTACFGILKFSNYRNKQIPLDRGSFEITLKCRKNKSVPIHTMKPLLFHELLCKVEWVSGQLHVPAVLIPSNNPILVKWGYRDCLGVSGEG